MTFTSEQKDSVLNGYIASTNKVVTRIRGDNKALWEIIDDPNWNWSVNEYRLLAYVSVLPTVLDPVYVYIKDGIYYWWNGYKNVEASTGSASSYYLVGFERSAQSDSYVWPSTTNPTASLGNVLTAQIAPKDPNIESESEPTIVYSNRDNKLDLVINGKMFQQDGRYEVIDSGGNQNISGTMNVSKLENGYVLSVQEDKLVVTGDLSVTGKIDSLGATSLVVSEAIETNTVGAVTGNITSVYSDAITTDALTSTNRMTQAGATVLDTTGGQTVEGDMTLKGSLTAGKIFASEINTNGTIVSLATNLNSAYAVPSDANVGTSKQYFALPSASNLPVSVTDSSTLSTSNLTEYLSLGAFIDTVTFVYLNDGTYSLRVRQELKSANLSKTAYRTTMIRMGSLSAPTIQGLSDGTVSWGDWYSIS